MVSSIKKRFKQEASNGDGKEIIDASFKAEDLLLEQNLNDGPILQLDIGYFEIPEKYSLGI